MSHIMNRREYLKATSLGLAALALPGCAVATNRPKRTKGRMRRTFSGVRRYSSSKSTKTILSFATCRLMPRMAPRTSNVPAPACRCRLSTYVLNMDNMTRKMPTPTGPNACVTWRPSLIWTRPSIAARFGISNLRCALNRATWFLCLT